ncbi:MAG TPA: hypothetical protein VGD24_05555 [Gallionella sp.]
MKKLLHAASHLHWAFAIFFAVMALVSVFGGYQLSRLLFQMNDTIQQRTDRLMVIEMSLDDAAIALGMQIQEWKDMLLRADDDTLYLRHRKAFQDAGVSVQDALLRGKDAMREVGLDTVVIDQLSDEHKSLVTSYLHAQARLNPRKIESAREVDKLVIGSDRNLQVRLAVVKDEVERLAQLQLRGEMPGEVRRYWLVGLLGASSLLTMALLGFVFALRFHGHEPGEVEYSTAT